MLCVCVCLFICFGTGEDEKNQPWLILLAMCHYIELKFTRRSFSFADKASSNTKSLLVS